MFSFSFSAAIIIYVSVYKVADRRNTRCWQQRKRKNKRYDVKAGIFVVQQLG